MRYIILLAFLIVSCGDPASVEEPPDPYPPGDNSILVEGTAGSSFEGDIITSYILEPVVLEQGKNAPNPEVRPNFGIGFIVPNTIFEEWKSVHGTLVHIELDWENENWHLGEIRN